MAGPYKFWTDRTLEPKRKYNWVMVAPNFPAFLVKGVKKPAFAISNAEHKFLNYTFNYPGRLTWEDVTITLVDPSNPDVSRTVYDLLEESGYLIPTDVDAASITSVSTISKRNSVDSLGLIEIKQIGHDGEELERWTLFNAYIMSADFGELDYEGDDLVEVQLTIKYDYATVDTANAGVEGL
tara:strand:+ start:2072 stop:2617 length:546 start_codon:yes stop_codon:yes gene_type:complete